MDDRYRGVFGRRDIIFMNRQDLAARGLKDGDRIDISGIGKESEERHLVKGFTVVEYNIPKGSAAGYYPEMNAVVSARPLRPPFGNALVQGVPITVSAAAI